MTKFISICIFVLSISTIANASHEGHGEGGHHEGPCMKDAETLCPNVEKGHGAKVKCLKENESKLSKECSAHMAEAKEAMKDIAEACHGDMENFCHDVKKGGGRVMKCMKSHKDQLSAGCKAEIEAKKEARKKK